MNDQEFYEGVRAFFNRPDSRLARAGNPTHGVCVYRGGGEDSPLRCGFGCMIPDELYQPAFEGKSAAALLSYSDVRANDTNEPIELDALRAHFEGVDPGFVQDVQRLHDGAENVTVFLLSLDRLAVGHGLKLAAEATA